MRLPAQDRRKYDGAANSGSQISERVPLVSALHNENSAYSKAEPVIAGRVLSVFQHRGC
jgi:hypothetical protein